jgi:hypothetical protein
MGRKRTRRRVIPVTAQRHGDCAARGLRIAAVAQRHERVVGEHPANHGIGSPGIGGIVIVTVFVPIVKLTLVLVLVLVLVPGEVEVVVVGSVVVVVVVVAVVVVVVGAVVVVVSVVDEGEGEVVVVGVAVREVVVSGVNGLLSLELEPPKINKMINTNRSVTRTPNRT